MKKNKEATNTNFSKQGRWLLFLSAIALTLKLLLQLGSTIPSLSQLAFGFRPIVIGYLHLVLLGVISIFIIGFIVSKKLLLFDAISVKGIFIFIAGIIINELFLMIQGVAALIYVGIPYINELLFIAALIMFSGLLLMNLKVFNLKTIS